MYGLQSQEKLGPALIPFVTRWVTWSLRGKMGLVSISPWGLLWQIKELIDTEFQPQCLAQERELFLIGG